MFPPFTVDTVNRTLLRDNRAVPLGSRAFDTLVTLIRHRDRVVEKEDFLREAWRGALVEESNLTKQVSLLRKVLEDTPGSHRYIVTVPGTGYRFGAQVEEREAAEEPFPRTRPTCASSRAVSASARRYSPRLEPSCSVPSSAR